jgi:hypothetical protein
VQDDFPTEDAAEDFDYFIKAGSGGGDESDTVHEWCHVVSIRKDVDVDTSGSAVAWNLKDPTTATRASGTTDTGSDGWTATSLNLLATTPLGGWTGQCTATFNGNTGTDTELFNVGIDSDPGASTMADPLKVFPTPRETYLNDTVLLSISAMFLDGTAREDAEDELLIDVYDPSGAAAITGASPVEVGGGIYRYEFTPDDGAGNYLVVVRNTLPATMGGATSNAFTVQNSTANATAADILDAINTHRANTLEIFGMSFNDLDFDGFLFFLFWFGLVLLCLVRGRVFAGIVATLGVLETLIPDIMPTSHLFLLFLLVIAVWLEAIAAGKLFANLRKDESVKPE